MTGPLLRYDQACRLLAEARAIDEVKEVRGKAEAIRAYARQAGNRRLEIDASEIRLRAERRVGEMMQEQRETIGFAPGKRTDLGSRSTQVTIPTLSELGITRPLAIRARRYAAVPVETFEELLATRRERLTQTAELVTLELGAAPDKAAQRAKREADLADKIAALPAKRFPVILADPEWQFAPWSCVTGMDRAAENHYPTSSLAALCARDVA